MSFLSGNEQGNFVSMIEKISADINRRLFGKMEDAPLKIKTPELKNKIMIRIFVTLVVMCVSLFSLHFFVEYRYRTDPRSITSKRKITPKEQQWLTLLKKTAYRSMQEYSTRGLDIKRQEERPQMEHFKFSKFQLSPNQSVGWDFQYNHRHSDNHSDRYPNWSWSSQNPSKLWTYVNKNPETEANSTKMMQDSNQTYIDNCWKKERFTCEIPMAIPLLQHFPHFAQYSFPCFSALQIARDKMKDFDEDMMENMKVGGAEVAYRSSLRNFANKLGFEPKRTFVMKLTNSNPRKEVVGRKSIVFVEGILSAFKKAGIQIDILSGSDDQEKYECEWEVGKVKNSKGDTGFPNLEIWKNFNEYYEDSLKQKLFSINRYPVHNTKFFSRWRDMDLFQRHVLGKKYEFGPSYKMPLRVLIMDRGIGSTRHWLYSLQTKQSLLREWNDNGKWTKENVLPQNSVLDVRVISNPSGNLKDQALAIHNADVIIASHGAALTNLAFIRPCTAVLELFPYGYYLGFFQSLVINGGGISFDGYLFDGEKRKESIYTSSVELPDYSRKMRSGNVTASPESIIKAFPTILLDVLTCRENWDGERDNA